MKKQEQCFELQCHTKVIESFITFNMNCQRMNKMDNRREDQKCHICNGDIFSNNTRRLGDKFICVQCMGSMLTLTTSVTVSYTHLRAHETGRNLVCRLLLE